jgi:hypothetical protein
MHECDEAAQAAAICIAGAGRDSPPSPHRPLAPLGRLRRRSRLAAKACEGVTAQRGDQSRPCLLQRFHKARKTPAPVVYFPCSHAHR